MWIEETRSGLSLQIARTIMSLRKLVVSSALAARRASPFSLSGARATYSSNVLIHMGGTDQGEIFSDAHKAICGTGGEVKESRSVRLGGRFSQMFLVANVDEATVELALKDFGHGIDYLNVQAARQTTRDMKGPYCATSPLVPFVRHARLTVHRDLKPENVFLRGLSQIRPAHCFCRPVRDVHTRFTQRKYGNTMAVTFTGVRVAVTNNAQARCGGRVRPTVCPLCVNRPTRQDGRD